MLLHLKCSATPRVLRTITDDGAIDISQDLTCEIDVFLRFRDIANQWRAGYYVHVVYAQELTASAPRSQRPTMPSKRKNKGGKMAAALAHKMQPHTASEGPGTKPGQARRNSLGARTSHLPPFSMTTRRGLKTASAASSANSGSRRSSMNDVAQMQDAPSDFEDAQAVKDSGSPVSNGSSNNKTFTNESIAVATPPVPKHAGAKRRASDSTQSSNTLKTRPSHGLARTHSDVSEQQPRRKKRKTAATPADSADQPPELTDASTAPNSPEQLPDVDGNQSLQNVLPTNGDAPAKPGRRLPGRRRQPHPDINIETDLRRQLKLKMDYRSLAKVQKTILEELSKRTISNLEKDENFHKQCPEYAPLMAQLDQRKHGRIGQIDALRTYRLEQLQRVCIAEERIQKEQYIKKNRFRDLQDDLLLQCYFRMKQIEREMKGDDAGATDDEDNVLPPTYTDEPHHDVEDRIGSKFASRSRAYVEADRELEDDARRKKFALARAAFVAKDEDADDAIGDAAGGFACFIGPDRAEAIAHHNLMSMADAAVELERTPTPRIQTQLPVIPNAQAVDLMMLAELSSQQTHDNAIQKILQPPQQAQDQALPAPRVATPPVAQGLTRQASSIDEPQPINTSPQAAHQSPVKPIHALTEPSHQTSRPDLNGIPLVAKETLPARVSTHRIMDILNDDQDVPVFRSREAQPAKPPQALQPSQPTQTSRFPQHSQSSHHPQMPNPQQLSQSLQPLLPSQTSQLPQSSQPPGTPPRHATAVSQPNTPSHGEVPDVNPSISNENASLDASIENEQPVDQALMDALGGRPSEPPSPLVHSRPWSRQSAAPLREAEEPPRRKDPLQKIRELLDRKARENGRKPPDRSPYRMSGGPSFMPRMPSMQPAQERQDVAGYDPTRPSAGLYGLPSSTAPSYSAPSAAARRESQDHGLPHWDRDRRMSASQVSQQPNQSPYNNPPPQPHQAESSRTTSISSAHQSPYTLPPGSLPLPPKPPGPPPPVNFRFAHYDPAPPRPSYPPASPTYPPSSHAAAALSSPQYQHNHHLPYQGGYIPPPGSFQAPPPPPPSHLTPFAPLKIHQYGGQPILPASMAPPPPSIVGSHTHYHSQQSSFQHAPPAPYSGSQGPPPPPQQQYEAPRGDESHAGERPEPQQRPRRQYRSYHAPGTQFRTYSGPKQGPRRES
ncbi:hypothetical protein ACEQ8H_007104 [Pleosporales sp. CAS-2024a]